jgi:hypothetical protein
MKRAAFLACVAALAGCGRSRGIVVASVDSGSPDGSVDAVAIDGVPLLPVPPGCESVQFTGSIWTSFNQNGATFGSALQDALQWVQKGQQVTLGVSGASDTMGFACFDGLVECVHFSDCSSPLRITVLPKGTSSLIVDWSCTVADISGATGLSHVDLEDASLVTDFSSLKGASDVTISGNVSLDLIGPYVLDASRLVLGVNATSLATLNNAKADHLWIDANGLHSLADYAPLPTLTCFAIYIDSSATVDERAAICSFCTATRSGPQCPDYDCMHACWLGMPPCEGS